MTTTLTESATGVILTETAATEIKALFKSQEMPDAALRVFVSGGGCSGLQYGMAIADEVEEGDVEFEQSGVRILVDPLSMNYINGATVDYVEDSVMGGGFKIDNPNATKSCGCGSSFSTEDEAGGCGTGGGGGCGSGCGCG